MKRLLGFIAVAAHLITPNLAHAEVDEGRLCKFMGYPKASGLRDFNNNDCTKIGSFSRFQEIFLHNKSAASTDPWTMSAGEPLPDDFVYNGQRQGTLASYLATHRVTGFLVMHDDKVVFERYQYGRKASDLMFSASLSKTILALLYGHAIADGKIKLTTKVTEVLPDFAGTAWANDTVEDLLRMTSATKLFNGFNVEGADNVTSSSLQMQQYGDLRALLKSKKDVVGPPGTVFYYSGMQTQVLGMMLQTVVGMTLTEYLHQRIWQPMGAEYPAAWIKDHKGNEGVQAFFTAAVRDYAKLGYLFINKGRANGKQVVPAEWIEQMTKLDMSKPQPDGVVRYGLHVWLTRQGQGRGRFEGANGQHITFDPVSRTVVVQTAATATGEDYEGGPHFFSIRDSLARFADAVAR